MPRNPALDPKKHAISIELNGRRVSLEVEPRTTLLGLLREDLGDTTPKEVCGAGNCGACTVLIENKPTYACLTLAVECDGRSVRTLAGLGSGEKLHPIQESFIRCDAAQCGYCTPGQIMSAVGLLEAAGSPTAEEIVRGMSGNLCRCGAYANIRRAVAETAEERSS